MLALICSVLCNDLIDDKMATLHPNNKPVTIFTYSIRRVLYQGNSHTLNTQTGEGREVGFKIPGTPLQWRADGEMCWHDDGLTHPHCHFDVRRKMFG